MNPQPRLAFQRFKLAIIAFFLIALYIAAMMAMT
jgi:hypothetical protein